MSKQIYESIKLNNLNLMKLIKEKITFGIFPDSVDINFYNKLFIFKDSF